MKAAILALALGIAAGAAVRAESGSRARHAPIVVPTSNVRCAAVVAHGAKHPRSVVRRPPGVYWPRRGDFGFF